MKTPPTPKLIQELTLVTATEAGRMFVEQIEKRGGDPLSFIQIASIGEALPKLLIAHSANLLAHAIEGTYGAETDVEVFAWAREILQIVGSKDLEDGGFDRRMN